jgi:hypothetical protein
MVRVVVVPTAAEGSKRKKVVSMHSLKFNRFVEEI